MLYLCHFKTDVMNLVYLPEIFNNNSHNELERLNKLLNNEYISIVDTYEEQILELLKINNPSTFLIDSTNNIKIDELKQEVGLGIWVFYPWKNTIVKTLPEKYFRKIRLNRNQYKITQEEQDLLLTKKIGVCGLSVGHSAALTLALEGIGGELRIADFDELGLSNLNRIRTGITNLGLPKTIITAREIAEIDPFFKITIFDQGITEENIDSFLNENGKLDVLVDECDSLDIKILLREKARENLIPVVMETSERNMLDIELYHLQPNYPILHGLVEGISFKMLKGLNSSEKIPFILKIIEAEKCSERTIKSLFAVGKSLASWPQLASSVTIGGGLVADATRRIILNLVKKSKRYYFDLDKELE